MDAALLTLYGHFLVSAASYTNALNYYFRALAADRGNAMTVLSIALAYMQYSMKRQCENRQHAVAMAVGFFRMYRTVRLGDVEVEVDADAEGEVVKEVDPESRPGDSGAPSATTAKAKARWVRSQRLMEVELNEGRFWHHLGLLHLAIPAYERCLAVAQEPLPLPHTRPQVTPEASPPQPNDNSASLDDAMDIDVAIDTGVDLGGDTVMQDNEASEGADQAEGPVRDAAEDINKEPINDQATDENKNKPNPEPQPESQPEPEDEPEGETEPEPEPDFKMEAAFALQHIWALGGDVAKARKITREWLVY